MRQVPKEQLLLLNMFKRLHVYVTVHHYKGCGCPGKCYNTYQSMGVKQFLIRFLVYVFDPLQEEDNFPPMSVLSCPLPSNIRMVSEFICPSPVFLSFWHMFCGSSCFIQHQNIINDLQEKTQSMGLILKPTKCRSLSICSGVPKVGDFHIDGKRVTPVIKKTRRDS